MRAILHIKSDTADARAEVVINGQFARTNLRLEVVDLRVAEPDYDSLVDKIFAAESVAVW